MSTKEEVIAKRRREKYNAKLLEFKEDNKRTLCFANLFSTVITIGCAVGTLVILNSETQSCSASYLRLTLWLMLGMHVINITEGVCGLTGLDKIFCGCLCIVGFFVYEVAVLVYMQSVFYSSGECKKETPYQYWWLLTNIIVYFVLLAILCVIHIRGMCGSPSEEEVNKELEEDLKNEKALQGNTLQ